MFVECENLVLTFIAFTSMRKDVHDVHEDVAGKGGEDHFFMQLLLFIDSELKEKSLSDKNGDFQNISARGLRANERDGTLTSSLP